MIREILIFVTALVLGVAAASAYFYNIHPEHHILNDIPLMRKDYEKAVEGGREAAQRWKDSGQSTSAPESTSVPVPVAEPQPLQPAPSIQPAPVNKPAPAKQAPAKAGAVRDRVSK